MRSIELVVKAFQRQETQFSPHSNMQQGQRSLTNVKLLDGRNRLAMGIIIHGLAAVFQLCRARSARLTLSTTMGSRSEPKNGKQTRWVAKEA